MAKHLLIGLCIVLLLGLGVTGLTYAQDSGASTQLDELLESADEELRGSSEQRSESEDPFEEADRELQGAPEEGAAEDLNPLEVLDEVSLLMRQAQQGLASAAQLDKSQASQQEAIDALDRLKPPESDCEGQGVDEATDQQQEAADELEKLIEQVQCGQQSVIEAIEKMMDSSSCRQEDAIEQLEKLIKACKACQGSGQGQQNQQQELNERSHNPAERPYEVPPHNPPVNENTLRAASEDPRWGELPERLREELLQSRGDWGSLQEYEERIREYFKSLSEDER